MRRDAGSQSESDEGTSDPSQHFTPREDDHKTLYEVIEITGERDNHYRVRWKGDNPETKKPWPQSWVPKRDCTDDLVLEWKKRNKRRKTKKSGRNSTATSRSVASSVKTKLRSESTATASNATKRRNEPSPSAGPSTVQSKSKHHFQEVAVKGEGTEERDTIFVRRQRTPVTAGRSGPGNPLSVDTQPKGTKRKLADAQSTNSSVNQLSGRRFAEPVSEGRKGRITVSGPPRKKRKFISALEKSPSPEISTKNHGEEEKETIVSRKGSGSVQTVNGKEDSDDHSTYHQMDERMVEDIPLDIAHMDDPNDKPRNDSSELNFHDDVKLTEGEGERHDANGKRKGNAVRVEDEESEVAVVDAPPQPRQSIQLSAASVGQVKSPRKPIARMMPSAPRPHGASTDSGSKVETMRPTAATKKPNEPSLIALSDTKGNQEPRSHNSASYRSPPPERHGKAQRSKPAESPRKDSAGVISIHDSDDPDNQVSLSPRARQRLALFDIEVMGKKSKSPAVEKKQSVNGAEGEASTSNRPKTPGHDRLVTSTVRPTLSFGHASYLVDVVPETEVEDSQEDQLHLPTTTVGNHEQIIADVSPPDASIAGPSLRPFPHLSPSAFHPHLRPPNSSLPETVIEPFSSHERRVEIEGIEQFESPEKSRTNGFTKKVVVLNKNGVIPETEKDQAVESGTNKSESAEAAREADIVRRGQEIVEQAEAMRRRIATPSRAGPTSGTTKKSIQEVVARAQSRSQSESNASQLDEPDDEQPQREEEGVADASTSVVPPASGPPALTQELPPPMDDMEQPQDDFIDWSGGMDGVALVDKTHDDIEETPANINPELLRQEEEESTQDIMAERRQHQAQPTGVHASDGCDPEAVDKTHDDIEETLANINPELLKQEEEEGTQDIMAEKTTPGHASDSNCSKPTSAEELKLANRPSSPPPQKKHHDDEAPRGPITRSRSRSKTPLMLARTLARGKTKELKIPSPVESRRESPEAEPRKSPDVFQNLHGSSTTSSILAVQISSLQTQVTEKQLKMDSLLQDLNSLREQLKSSEDRDALLKVEGQNQMAELQSQWANEKSTWENGQAMLIAQGAASEKARTQAEQDREFIREQYANASAYVTTIREENKELEQRVKIAEDQAKKGVELIKATFESRVAKLQDDAEAWRRIAEFVREMDIRTNDDIRRRAAEEPELRLLCVRQKKALKEARKKIEALEADLLEKSGLCDTATEEMEIWKKENARLQSDINEAHIKLDRIGRSGDESSQGDGHEFVYRCMWRMETENSQTACPEVFVTMQELEQHLYSGHLSRQ